MTFHDLLHHECGTGWQRWSLWCVCIMALTVLGVIQTVTEANFALASAALLPVLTIAWFCEREAQRSRRHRHSMAVIFLDLDHFKQLNDTQGHGTGDLALQETAKVLLSHLRSIDCVARLGRDEFAILLPAVGWDVALQTAFQVAAVLRTRLARFPPVTASLGQAWFSEADRPFPAMLRAAEELLYQAKKTGSDTVRSQRFDT
jgi:diguanylate cyclase (GGDEF)-like protein